ncbi:MAG: wax ester/triacylglycerol synthase family O-acyltransferase [Acidimicrobiia bacterium]
MPAYDRLSALDESFLHLERADTPMHVGAVAVLERDPFYGLDGRFRLDAVRELVRSRLELLPRFRRTVMSVPYNFGRPIWVDDPNFDVSRHVRLTSLPAPGNRRQLLELAERLAAQVLDRAHPLWEIWFVEGLDGGKRVGLLHKSHHTLTDGISGVDIATALLDLEPTPPPVEVHAWEPEPGPLPMGLLVDTMFENTLRGVDLMSHVQHAVNGPRAAAGQVTQLGRSLSTVFRGGPVAPRLSWNDTIAPGRKLETFMVPLAMARDVRAAFGCTVNDVVLAAVGGGVARLLEQHGDLSDDLVVKVFCPVSVRDDSQRSQLGNRISTMIVPLPVGDPDPQARLDAVRASTAELKAREQAVGAATLIGLGEYAAPTLLGLAARAAHSQPLANLIVTNIPGPQVPLYLLGAQMLEVYPIVPLSRNLTLNVAVLSYCGQLHFGLIGDGESAHDLEVLAGGIEDAFAELLALAALR